jgi:putative ABC transport system substrate-binding protein
VDKTLWSGSRFQANRKSKIKNLKWVGFLAVLVLFVGFGDEGQAQQSAKIPRIGFLTGSSLSATAARNEAFCQGLRALGYVEDKNIIIEWRSWEGKRERQHALALELARLNLDVIVAVGSRDVGAVKEATATTPIVMIQGGDAVGSGFVESLARPGGNITGLTTLRPELSAKRLELLKEVIPGLLRVAVFVTSAGLDHAQVIKELDLAAEALGVKLQYLDVLNSEDIEAAFRAAAKERVHAILFRVGGPFVSSQRPKIAALAAKSRLPVMYERGAEVEAGGLMSYGVRNSDLYRRAAVYVDKILKGAKPADLPVEQPTKFELVINLKTAKQIGLTIPPEVLMRADKVIK